MAKQIGIHQIKGKVGNRSYYRQSGVADGLSREINQALSGRVKEDPAYANTRLNNREFGQACKIAGVLGRFIQPKFRPMILPFSQSLMAQIILDVIKNDPTASAQWGYRGLVASPLTIPVEALNACVKNRIEDIYGDIEMTLTAGTGSARTLTFNGTPQSGAPDFLQSIGADGVYTKVIACSFIYKRPVAADQEDAIVLGLPRRNATDDSSAGGFDPSVTVEVEVTFVEPTAPEGGAVGTVAVVIVMPYRTIGGTQHILQEYCTYRAEQVDEV
mgnify:CR=1 FL=1